jgi:hypothetical protein
MVLAFAEPAAMIAELDMLTGLALVTVSGTKHFNRDFARPCLESWRRIQGVSTWGLIDDGLLPEDVGRAGGDGFSVYERDPPAVVESLSRRPGLQIMRRASPTWRHVVDTVILCRQSEHVVLIDTDVFVTEPVAVAKQGLDFIYNCDDIPGFRGKWYLPLAERMMPAINPGFMVLRPQAVDLDLLEDLVQRYFVDAKNYWWTRQSALSVLVARSEKRGLFDGNDVRVFSGSRKRSPAEIRANIWKMRGDRRLATDADWVADCLRGAAVLHLAGKGKGWLSLAQQFERTSGPPRVLKTVPAPHATPFERGLIAFRMFAIQAGRGWISRRPAKSSLRRVPT